MGIVNGLLPWVAVRSIRSGFRPTTETFGKPVDNFAQVEPPVAVVKHSDISSDVIGIREIRIEHDVVGRDIRQIELMSTRATLAVVPLKTCPLRAPNKTRLFVLSERHTSLRPLPRGQRRLQSQAMTERAVSGGCSAGRHRC